jgi:hypothetical protein
MTSTSYQRKTAAATAALLGHQLSAWQKDKVRHQATCQLCGASAFVMVDPASNQAPTFGAALTYRCQKKE